MKEGMNEKPEKSEKAEPQSGDMTEATD